MSIPRKNDVLLVGETMLKPDAFPVVSARTILKEALEEMGRYRLGVACIIDQDAKLIGIFTDGDIRRKLLKVQKPFSAFIVDDVLVHATRTPTTIPPVRHLARRHRADGKEANLGSSGRRCHRKTRWPAAPASRHLRGAGIGSRFALARIIHERA
jgi:hypothetical protein